ncbi:hypothetical protein CK203_028918 [Vitis vinifera]|uniref:DUF659 domain-containing protein n=1 Tax=Vitis vinifera TaxID=29760 RepID=A0A438IAD2_VITVI|nr:hypothetical protein CK203_028918 [Vitis vinifera]
MASKHDIGWEHAEPVGGSRRITKCDFDDEIEEVAMADFERRQMKQAMKESRGIFEEGGQEHQKGGSSSQPSNARIKRGLTRSFSVREGASIPLKGIDPYMFPSKHKSIKSLFSTEGVKKVGKAISKFFLFNAIPFNAADSGPYYQSIIDTIAEVGSDIKGPTGYQIGNTDLEEEVQELEVYITTLKAKWPIYGCTIMCDGWSSRTRKPIINFMIYCDRSMIYHSSVDTTNILKTADYIFSLMDKVVEEVGEKNVVQVVTDNEASFKAASMLLMEKRKHLFWSPCATHYIDLMLEDIGSMKQINETLNQAKMITGFIYNSLKVVNLMKVFTKNRDQLRPGITRFAIELISLESLIRYEADLKRMCTTNEWCEFNKDRSKKSLRNKPILSIIYEAMDRAKLAIKASVKQWEKYWEVIDRRWDGQLHRHLHATVGFKEVIKRLEPDLDRQAKVINKVKLFVDGQGEFGSALTKKAINQSLLAEWWNNYGDEGPHLQKIAVKILSQTCSSSGLFTNEKGRERDVDSRCKGKASRTISSKSSSNDGDNRGSRRGGGTSESTGGDGSTGGEGYSNTETRASDSYGYDQSSSSSSISYRGFGYYQSGVDPEQPSKPYFPNYGSSSQSSHPTYSSYEQLFQPYPHYRNCHPNLYARHRTDDDDFEPPRHSTWN